jgi:hypothetical protein
MAYVRYLVSQQEQQQQLAASPTDAGVVVEAGEVNLLSARARIAEFKYDVALEICL